MHRKLARVFCSHVYRDVALFLKATATPTLIAAAEGVLEHPKLTPPTVIQDFVLADPEPRLSHVSPRCACALEIARSTDELWRTRRTPWFVRLSALELHAGVHTRMLVNEEDGRGGGPWTPPPPPPPLDPPLTHNIVLPRFVLCSG